jgi:tetratricopeptide (TPR) repeat protein
MRLVFILIAFLLASREVASATGLRVAGHNGKAIGLENQAAAQMKKGDFEGARKSLDEALRLDAKLWTAYWQRADLDMVQHKWELAAYDAGMALHGGPLLMKCAIIRATANTELRKYDVALAEFDHLIGLAPSEDAYPYVLGMAAWIRATCPDSRYRNGKVALEQAKHACKLTLYKDPRYLEILAASQAENGDFESALTSEEKAIALEKDPKTVKRLQEEMSFFKQRKPIRL